MTPLNEMPHSTGRVSDGFMIQALIKYTMVWHLTSPSWARGCSPRSSKPTHADEVGTIG
jgi:hypothetical protein